MPSWYGFHDPDLTAKYIAFVRQHLHAMREGRGEEIESEVRMYSREVRDDTDRLASRPKLEQKLAAIETRLRDTASMDEQLREAVADLQSLPNVVGARPDSRGHLVVHLRFIDEETGRHQGDFEISIASSTWNDALRIIIAKTCDSRYDLGLETYNEPGYRAAWHITNNTTIQERFEVGDLIGVIQCVTDQISGRLRAFYRNMADADSIPDPTWTGIMPGLTGILAKTIKEVVHLRTKREVESVKMEIERFDRDRQYLIERIRKHNIKLRSLRAELKQLSKYKDGEIAIDEAERREELRYITSLEGVMGMRFNNEGVPVFHLRTSTIYRDERYDLGDFEITFASNRSHYGVLQVAQTRGGENPYYHREFHSDDWFCFGHRADALTELFREGKFGTLMHALINTMNFVNVEDRRAIPRRHQRIPVDCVWTPPKKRSRRRRRDTRLQTA